MSGEGPERVFAVIFWDRHQQRWREVTGTRRTSEHLVDRLALALNRETSPTLRKYLFDGRYYQVRPCRVRPKKGDRL